MTKSIILGGRVIEYELCRKQVKNINLRIKPDMSISVSANWAVPTAAIESFIRSKEKLILRALDRYARRGETAAKALDYNEGELVRLFGEDRLLHIVESGRSYVSYDGFIITLRVKDTENYELRKKTLDKWLKEKCTEKVTEICEKVYPEFEKRGVRYPEIKFRTMTSCWGSCRPTRGALTFNTALVHATEECIEYVAVHEFSHFLHPDHSAAFHACVAEILPDWKERKKLLRESVII